MTANRVQPPARARRPLIARHTLVALVLLAGSVALMVAGALLVFVTDPTMAPPGESTGKLDVVVGMGLLGFPVIGALIVWRRPEHRIGRLYLGLGVGIAVFLFADGWATYALAGDPDTPPGGIAAAWVATWLGALALYAALTWPLLLFPTGRLPGPRWRWAFGLATGSIVVVAFGFAFAPGELASYESFENPLAIPGATGEALAVVTGIAVIVASLSVVVAAAAAVVRLRRARGAERQQLKWFVWSGGLVAAGFTAALVIALAFELFWWAGALVVLSLLGMLATTGIAILRYRLYDIDLIINRTIVYATLTALLGAVYAGGVVVLQQALATIASGSDLAVAGTTLAVAALVRPGRDRIQRLVDRRFYRHKYDAERTIDRFSDRLRDELDLDALVVEVRAVVHETMQPAFVSVWLREPGPAGDQ